MAQAQRAASQVLDQAMSGREIGAVLSLSLKTNSGLTRNRARLQEAIKGLQARNLYKADSADCPSLDYYQADLIENKHDLDATQDAVRKVYNCNPSLDPKYQANVAENAADSAARRELSMGHQDVQNTYAAISAFVRTLATLPGERTLILISPGFLRIEQETLLAESRLMELAAESNVTINALDARALYSSEMTACDKSSALGGPSFLRNSDYKRTADKLAEQPMAELADATGGVFYRNRNDLNEGFKQLVEAPEVVYVLELSLAGVKADGSYHRLKVKVDREGVEIQARHGYSAPKPEKNKK
jgi:VWFA-related protein